MRGSSAALPLLALSLSFAWADGAPLLRAPQAAAEPAARRGLQAGDMGRQGIKEVVAEKMKKEGELEIPDPDGNGTAIFETVEERIEALKEIVQEKQRTLRDFILDQGIDEKAEIMAMQDDLQKWEKEYKSLVIANTPPTPAPYEDGHGECIDGDCEDGEGVYEWANGGHFEGTFVNGSKNGHGWFEQEESGRFTGMWKNGKPDGPGEFIAKDNQWNYTGNYENGFMEGKGVYTFERCRWSMIEKIREHYCTNKDRIVVYRGSSAYKGSLSECAAQVQDNPACGNTLYYAGSSTAPTSDCVCLKKDLSNPMADTCKPKPSSKVNHVYTYACEGGVLDGHFKGGAPHGPGSWKGFDGGSYEGGYDMGQMTNGTFKWPDPLDFGGQQGTYIGPWRLKVPVWENGTYISSKGVVLPGGNRSADQKELEAEEQARVDAIDEMEEEDLRAIYRKSRRHTNPVAAQPELTAWAGAARRQPADRCRHQRDVRHLPERRERSPRRLLAGDFPRGNATGRPASDEDLPRPQLVHQEEERRRR